MAVHKVHKGMQVASQRKLPCGLAKCEKGTCQKYGYRSSNDWFAINMFAFDVVIEFDTIQMVWGIV
jgi:hypothetical protein